ncbi:MAG: LacI family DNA-binding transcriptional regulator [Clostridia bacterium]|nr:LacI family DNA-binding transcriptional regulator [Clostridia bacterium]
MARQPVTMQMLARELGLSLSAVSKALNDYPDIGTETKKLVLGKAAELGYTPNILARSLARKTSSSVGVVLRDVSSIYGEMYKSLNEVARRYALHLILYDTDNDPAVEKWCIQNLIDSMAMGIVISPVSEDISGIREITRGRVPVVFLGGKVTDDSVNYVCSDSAAGTQAAVGSLIESGHRRIAMVCDSKKSSSRSSKLTVYRRMMSEIGQPARVFFSGEADTDAIRAGYLQGRRLLGSGDEFTAAFVVKDVMALGVIQALTEAGIQVPEEFSVIGYDGIDAAGLPMVSLTTVAQPRMEMAEKVIDILRRHAEDADAPPEHYLALPELVKRKSTAAAGYAARRI